MGFITTPLINAGAFPLDMVVSGPPPAVLNSWNGAVQVWVQAPGDFWIYYDNVPASACIALASAVMIGKLPAAQVSTTARYICLNGSCGVNADPSTFTPAWAAQNCTDPSRVEFNFTLSGAPGDISVP